MGADFIDGMVRPTGKPEYVGQATIVITPYLSGRRTYTEWVVVRIRGVLVWTIK